jgi:two-component system NtrC family sensor kinase
METVAKECLDQTETVMRRQAGELGKRNRRQLMDLPWELTADDADRTREMVDGYATSFGRTYSQNVRFLAREFADRTGEQIVVHTRRLSDDFLSATVTGLTVLLGALLVLTALSLARTVLVPVARLVTATEAVAEGDLSERVAMTRNDEVGRLGRAFDRMTAALRASRQEIEELNLTLADKVREKTVELEVRNAELVRTIADLEAARDALVHSETMASIGRLSGGVAHEFNNLLGGIIGVAEDAATDEEPEAIRDALKMILKTARRACNITENLLRFSRPPARHPAETALAGLVAEALSLVRPEMEKRGVTARVDLAEIEPILLDPGQIHQVVLNLLTNALRAMPAGGTLEVTVAEEEGHVTILVRDDGVGIAEEHLSRIFEPFFTTREGDEPGTGLGLSVSYGIVRSHGGAIEVTSRPGEGAEFRVRLPRGR